MSNTTFCRPIMVCALLSLLVCTNFAQNSTPNISPNTTSVAQSVPKIVTVTVTVTDDKNRFVTGLSRDSFSIFEGKSQKEISLFEDEDSLASIGILLDVSGSTKNLYDRGNYKVAANKSQNSIVHDALKRLLEGGNAANDYFVAAFNEKAFLMLDTTTDQQAVLSKVDALAEAESRGNTALYDACYASINKLLQSQKRKRVLILISDGQDTFSKVRFEEVKQAIDISGVLVYSLSIKKPSYTSTSYTAQGGVILKELAEMSGGKAYFLNNSTEVFEVVEIIALELQHQYTLGFAPTQSDGKNARHSPSIKVKLPPDTASSIKKVSVRARKNYIETSAP